MPLYLQAIGNIKHSIGYGEYKVGDRVPSETVSCERCGLSRSTLRRAVCEFVDAGFLVKRQERGALVKSTRKLKLVQTRMELMVQSFTDACKKNGFMVGSVGISGERRTPTAEEVAFFNLPSNAFVFSSARVGTVDVLLIMLETDVFPYDEFYFLTGKNLENVSHYQVIRENTGEGSAHNGAL